MAEPGARRLSAAPDERHGFLESFAMLLLRLRPDKWSKFEGSEDARAVLDEFFRQPDVLELLLSLNPAGQLQPSTCFLPTLKGKGIYFVKRKKENITQENCRAALLVGDISPWPVEQLIVVVEEVGRPHGPRLPGLPCRGAAVANTRGGARKAAKGNELTFSPVLTLTLPPMGLPKPHWCRSQGWCSPSTAGSLPLCGCRNASIPPAPHPITGGCQSGFLPDVL